MKIFIYQSLSIGCAIIGIMILINAMPSNILGVLVGFSLIIISLLCSIQASLYEIKDKLK